MWLDGSLSLVGKKLRNDGGDYLCGYNKKERALT